nr:MAG TPA: hypothetical protein [Caudoviricetes sp.]
MSVQLWALSIELYSDFSFSENASRSIFAAHNQKTKFF